MTRFGLLATSLMANLFETPNEDQTMESQISLKQIKKIHVVDLFIYDISDSMG